MQQRTETVSFRLSREERDLLTEILNEYSIKGQNLSERFRALLHELDAELTPASMQKQKKTIRGDRLISSMQL